MGRHVSAHKIFFVAGGRTGQVAAAVSMMLLISFLLLAVLK